MQVMGALNAGGFRQIGLVTDPGGPRLDGRTGEAAGVNTGFYISAAGHSPRSCSGSLLGGIFRVTVSRTDIGDRA